MYHARLRALALAGALLAPLSLAAVRPRTQGDLLDRAVAGDAASSSPTASPREWRSVIEGSSSV